MFDNITIERSQSAEKSNKKLYYDPALNVSHDAFLSLETNVNELPPKKYS